MKAYRCARLPYKGQVTLRKDLLKHLGVNPGDKITVDKLPDGRIEVKAARPAGKISDGAALPSAVTEIQESSRA